MNKNKKPYIIRGFNMDDEGGFNCTGAITKFKTFSELVVNKQFEAIVEMESHYNFRWMSARRCLLTGGKASDQTKDLYVLDVCIYTDADDVSKLRSYRTRVRDTLKTWAEKSRVKGRRGWRLNAIKTPTFEFDKQQWCVVIKTQFILSTAIFYDQNTVTINDSFDMAMEQEDLKNLDKGLRRLLGSMYNSIKYRHSEIGTGEVF